MQRKQCICTSKLILGIEHMSAWYFIKSNNKYKILPWFTG